MDIAGLLAAFAADKDGLARIEAHHVTEPKVARFAPFPEFVHERLRTTLESRGILQLYEHQARAARLLHEGTNVVVATPTASGKSLCFHLPVLDALLRGGGDARALYLFPTKALARDQMDELEEWLRALQRSDLVVAVYDGDTPPAQRRALREGGHLVLTNPHMLHSGILPNHTKWQGLFTGLRYVVVDEVHTLSGVYGSHVANVLRRLRRICEHYGSKPVFCAASASISNPGEHCQRLFEAPFTVIDEDGSARERKHYVFLNPRVVQEASGMRVPAIDVARSVSEKLIDTELQTIYFTRSRNTLEVLLKYLRDLAKKRNVDQERVMGYRGGYLPDLRRKVERDLQSGKITSVVATSALELGVDIGSLDVCVLLGYPGTVSSTFQRAGRVGRRERESAVLFVARSFAIDQYLMRNPGWLFDAPREAVSIDPDNAIILTNHVKCAAFELPIAAGSGFGAAEHVDEVLDFLTDDLRVLVREGDRWHYSAGTYPAEGVSLNAADMDNVVIVEADSNKILAEIDRPSALTAVHEGAIYGHQGEQYVVEHLDWKNRRATVRKTDPDYFTEAETETEVKVLHVDDTKPYAGYAAHRGEVHVSTLAKGYKKVRFYTRENVGAGEIHLPPEEFETEACMLVIDRALAQEVGLHSGADAGGLRGVAELVQGLVPLFVRVDPGDVRVLANLEHPHFEAPTLVIYDNLPDGVGLSDRLFARHRDVLEAARGVLARCPCRTGCPACIGPSPDQGLRGKPLAKALLAGMLR